jgi:hypothetical protein
MESKNTVKLYRLKEEFRVLFSNLAKGKAATGPDTFRVSGGRKSIASEEESKRNDRTIAKLVKAGFVSEEDSGIGFRDKT